MERGRGRVWGREGVEEVAARRGWRVGELTERKGGEEGRGPWRREAGRKSGKCGVLGVCRRKGSME